MTARPHKEIPVLTESEVARFYGDLRIGGCGVTWAGEILKIGYGQFTLYREGPKARLYAHRVAYKLATGEDPGCFVVRHDCDTPLCCTPDCLRLGTQADNMHDAMERNRMDLSGLEAYRVHRDARVRDRIARGEKSCRRCRLTKPFDEFSRSGWAADGHSYECKSCDRDQRAKRKACARQRIKDARSQGGAV